MPRANFSGRWAVDFSTSDDLAVGEFEVLEDGRASGTFLTTTGDYRRLLGRVEGSNLTLSTFDGAHLFLFKAALQADGSIAGDFWSGNWYHTAWTATRDPNASLPDAFEMTEWTGEGLDTLELPDLEGGTRSLNELISDGPVILDLFGSWCPNCADAADLLAEYQDRYGERGLRIVGLAFEHGDDLERSRERVTTHQRHHGARWPVLIAGSSDKKKASEAFPALDRVRAYPTLVFLEDGEALAVHTGFSGPATGAAYEGMRLRFERLIEQMLD
ncbi:MAG: TlpA disulfide reductase family protein [Planctomycetota bacterium]